MRRLVFPLLFLLCACGKLKELPTEPGLGSEPIDPTATFTRVQNEIFTPTCGAIGCHDEVGYEIILWDVDPYDWKRPGAAVVCNRILKETRAGSIVLSHDIHPGTIEAMPRTLDQLEAKGFKFVTVSELIRMARPEPGKEPAKVPTTIAPPQPVPTTPLPPSSG